MNRPGVCEGVIWDGDY